jgi:hypothetical protein
MDSTPIYKESSEPILTPGFELSPCFIKLIWDKSFLGEGDENPYSHLQEFEQICACLYIAVMLDNTLRWKLSPFSLMGRAKHWYNQTIGSMQEDWKILCSKFCLRFFPISKEVIL